MELRERQLGGSVPMTYRGVKSVFPKARPVADGGKRYRRVGLRYACQIPEMTPDGRLGPMRGTFYLYGDVPSDLLEFVPGRKFGLKEFYRGSEPVPVSQQFWSSQENGPVKEYAFTK